MIQEERKIVTDALKRNVESNRLRKIAERADKTKNIITYEMALKLSIHSLVEILQDVAPQVFDEKNEWNLLLNECRYRTNDEYKSKCRDEETILLDSINRGLRKWGVKEKLSFDDGFDLLTALQKEIVIKGFKKY